jgi:hypothetical protein
VFVGFTERPKTLASNSGGNKGWHGLARHMCADAAGALHDATLTGDATGNAQAGYWA